MKKMMLPVFLLIFSVAGHSQDKSAERVKEYNLEKGVAISGYDPVGYFTQHKALKGSKENSVFYEGVTYYFSSAANKEEFKKNPSAYEPQYGGWCAYAMGKDGAKVEVDPETFKLINGKLYLFYNKFFNNTLKSWNKDETNLQQHAEINWKKFIH